MSPGALRDHHGVNLALGMITPPFGVSLSAACTVARVSYDRIIPAVPLARRL